MRRGRSKGPDRDAPGPSPGLSADEAGHVMLVEEEVLRDLRHSVGNHFHKLYYWADRIASEEEATARRSQVEELNGTLQRFQELLELGFRYFEPDHASPMEVRAEDAAEAIGSTLRSEYPDADVAVEMAPELAGRKVRLDPQRFSLAVRTTARMIGGASARAFACRCAPGADGSSVDLELSAAGGDAPLEVPVMEWAVARKSVAQQGGRLRRAATPDGGGGGCVLSLPLGS